MNQRLRLGLRVQKGYAAKKILAEFQRKYWSIASVDRLLLSEPSCKSECTAADPYINHRKERILGDGASSISLLLAKLFFW